MTVHRDLLNQDNQSMHLQGLPSTTDLPYTLLNDLPCSTLVLALVFAFQLSIIPQSHLGLLCITFSYRCRVYSPLGGYLTISHQPKARLALADTEIQPMKMQKFNPINLTPLSLPVRTRLSGRWGDGSTRLRR